MNRDAAYASALAAAFAADLDTPSVAKVVQTGGLTREQFSRIVKRDVARGLSGEPGPALFPNVRAFARQVVDMAAIRKSQLSANVLSDMLGDTDPLMGGIGMLGGAIVGAVGAIWSTKIQTDAAKNLAKIRLQEAQIVATSQELAAKSALIQNATANGLLANKDGQPIDPSTNKPLSEIGQAAQAKVAGVPAWVLGTAAAASVVGGIYAFS